MATMLTNTLNGLDVNTIRQAIAQMEQEQTAQAAQQAAQTAQAQQASMQANQAYQQAAAQPPPQLGLGVSAVSPFFSNLASILSGNQNYQQNAEQRVEMSRAELLKARADNLQALRDVSQQKADEARRAGDLEGEHKLRTRIASLDKNYDTLNTLIQQQGATDRTRIDAGTRETPEEKNRREQIDNIRTLLNSYIVAGKDPPPILVNQGVKYGVLPEGSKPENFQGGARKPTALEIKNTLIQGGSKNVSVLPDDKYLAQRALRERAVNTKRGMDRKAGRESLKNFDLNVRRAGETPEQFIARLSSVMDPLKPKQQLYSIPEIQAAGKRLFSEAERQVE